MAGETFRYTSAAGATKQIDSLTPANVETDDIFTIIITSNDGETTASVSFTATAATVANVTAGLTTAFNASTDPLLTPITASDESSEVRLTADEGGVGFTCTTSTVEGGGNDTQTLTRAEVMPNSGPYHFDNPHNWSTSVAQVDVITIGPGDAQVVEGDTWTIQVVGRSGSPLDISFTSTGAATMSEVISDLVALWNASTDARCSGVTAADTSPTMTLTADVAGTPFYILSTSTDSAAGTFVHTSSTGYPTTAGTQTVYIEDAKIIHGLDQSAQTILSKLVIRRSQIGLNADATGTSPVYLQAKCLITEIDEPIGIGAGTPKAPVNLDVGASAGTITVFNTTTNSKTSIPAVLLKGDTLTDVKIYKGKVGFGFYDWEVANVDNLYIFDETSGNTGTDVYLGLLADIDTALYQFGGECWSSCADIPTVNLHAGNLKTYSVSTQSTATNIYGGTFESNGTGTIADLNGYGGVIDFTKTNKTNDVTAINIDPSCTVKYNPAVLTLAIAPITTAENIQYICSVI